VSEVRGWNFWALFGALAQEAFGFTHLTFDFAHPGFYDLGEP